MTQPQLTTSDGTVLSALPVGKAPNAFADEPRKLSAPAKVQDKEAPFGRDGQGKPVAPHGLKADGTPRLTSSGKKAVPKVAQAAQGGSEKTPKGTQGKDRTQELTGLVQLGWGVLSVTSPADAAALKLYGPGMVTAWNDLAKTNSAVAKGIDWLTSGGAYGAVVVTSLPFIMQVMANRDKTGKTAAQFAGFGVKSPAELEEMTKADLAEAAAYYAEQEAA